MVVCPKCRREMHCVLNGVICLFGKSHGYPGDKYECGQCQSVVVVAPGGPHYYPNASDEPLERLVQMLEGPIPDDLIKWPMHSDLKREKLRALIDEARNWINQQAPGRALLALDAATQIL